jgi:hypothetical protein
MPTKVNQFEQTIAMTKVIEVAPQTLAFQSHVRQITEGLPFKVAARVRKFYSPLSIRLGRSF